METQAEVSKDILERKMLTEWDIFPEWHQVINSSMSWEILSWRTNKKKNGHILHS